MGVSVSTTDGLDFTIKKKIDNVDNTNDNDNGDNKDKDKDHEGGSSSIPEISKVEEKKGEEEEENKVKKVENVGDLLAGIDEMKKSGATSQRFVFNSQPYDPEGVL